MKIQHQNIWFYSDPHFGHKNIIEYDKRPFKSIKEHDECIIENYNSVVADTDLVICLGDFAFKNIPYYLAALNGHKHFVLGNHDRKPNLLPNNHRYLELKVKRKNEGGDPRMNWQMLCLFHYPIAEWNRGHRNSYHLYGHTHHNSLYDREFQPKHKCLNMGINGWNYTPVSYSIIERLMSKKGSIEHH